MAYITKRYTGVDSTTGQALSFDDPVSAFEVIVESGAAFTFTGAVTGSDTLGSDTGRFGMSEVNVKAGHVLGTIYAVSGTINVSIRGWRF